jgi:hypothetical protein
VDKDGNIYLPESVRLRGNELVWVDGIDLSDDYALNSLIRRFNVPAKGIATVRAGFGNAAEKLDRLFPGPFAYNVTLVQGAIAAVDTLGGIPHGEVSYFFAVREDGKGKRLGDVIVDGLGNVFDDYPQYIASLRERGLQPAAGLQRHR